MTQRERDNDMNRSKHILPPEEDEGMLRRGSLHRPQRTTAPSTNHRSTATVVVSSNDGDELLRNRPWFRRNTDDTKCALPVGALRTPRMAPVHPKVHKLVLVSRTERVEDAIRTPVGRHRQVNLPQNRPQRQRNVHNEAQDELAMQVEAERRMLRTGRF